MRNKRKLVWLMRVVCAFKGHVWRKCPGRHADPLLRHRLCQRCDREEALPRLQVPPGAAGMQNRAGVAGA